MDPYQNRKQYNMILLFLQKKEIYKNYYYNSLDNSKLLENYYFLANKNWVKDYQSKFNFEEFEDFESKDVLFYDEAKINTRLIELNKYAKAFKDMNCPLCKYKKEEDIVIKNVYEIHVPQNIELLSDDYFNSCLPGVDFGFEKVKVYIKKDTMLMVKEGNDKVIFICDLENIKKDEGNGLEFNYDFDIKIKGIIILEKIDLENIILQISVFGIKKYLEKNNINIDNEEIQEITSNINKGEIIALYIKYSNNNFITNENDNNNDTNIESNIDSNIDIDNNNEAEEGVNNKVENIKIGNPFYIPENDNKEEIKENKEELKEEDNKEEEEEEEEESDDEDTKKENEKKFLELYWNSVPEFYLNEALNEINEIKINKNRTKLNHINFNFNQIEVNNQVHITNIQLGNQNENNNYILRGGNINKNPNNEIYNRTNNNPNNNYKNIGNQNNGYNNYYNSNGYGFNKINNQGNMMYNNRFANQNNNFVNGYNNGMINNMNNNGYNTNYAYQPNLEMNNNHMSFSQQSINNLPNQYNQNIIINLSLNGNSRSDQFIYVNPMQNSNINLNTNLQLSNILLKNNMQSNNNMQGFYNMNGNNMSNFQGNYGYNFNVPNNNGFQNNVNNKNFNNKFS